MEFNKLVYQSCEKSSVHGIPYLVNSKLHLLEKFFWFTIIMSAGYYSIRICWNQWQRFRDNPIVYAMELTWGKNDFPYAGITLCSDFYNEQDSEELIERIWGHTPNSSEYKYYREFLGVVNVMRYDTMYTLQRYANDTTLKNLDYLDLLLSMRKSLLPARKNLTEVSTKPTTNNFPTIYEMENRPQVYAAAITEAGMCRTISQLSEYTNPYGELTHLPVSDILNCGFLNDCSTKIFPMIGDTHNLFIYLHNVHDIVAPNDRSTVMRSALPDVSLTIELLLSWTTAETEVRNLPIAYRKCRYTDENYLEYFKIYRPGLCRIECRIDAALALCQCKPYFYAVAPHAPVCDIKGMLCLVANNWTETKCNCVKLCEELTYTSTMSTEQKDETAKFERTIIVKLTLPRMSLKRRVVFSTDQLIVSFGGAIGLFLGASFISIFEIVFAVGEFMGINMLACLRRKKILRARKVQPAVTTI